MRQHEVIIPEVVYEGPTHECGPCPYMGGDCGRCPHRGIADGQPAALALNVQDLTNQINAWLASPSPLFGWPWEAVLIGGGLMWALWPKRGGR